MPPQCLPADEPTRGLAERPAVFEPCEATLSSKADQSEAAADRRGLIEPGPRVMQAELAIACRYGAAIERIAARFGFLPSVIAGFCSRRSGWGLDLTPSGAEGTRDFRPRPIKSGHRSSPLPPDGLGFVRGFAGLDFDWHKGAREPYWRDPEKNLRAAFDVIAGYQRALRRRTTLQGTGLLRASFAAFECGIGRVEHAIRAGRDVDSPTVDYGGKGQGCGSDVLARAGFFQAKGWD